jgi:glycosyltransferase involved in cell wall biosynthesis
MVRGVDVVVPVCNEAENIDEFYARVAGVGLADALIVVDNASTDGTLERLARHPNVRVVRHATNEGYGASLRDGLVASTAERVVIIDADLEYPPEAIPALVAMLDESPVVYGSRFLGTAPPQMPLLRRAGNRLVSRLYNRLFGQQTTDLYTGMKGFRRGVLDFRVLRRTGFEHCVELAALLAVAGHQIAEIPIEYTPRNRGRSKMRHVPETLKLAACIVGYRLGRGALRRRLEGTVARR